MLKKTLKNESMRFTLKQLMLLSILLCFVSLILLKASDPYYVISTNWMVLKNRKIGIQNRIIYFFCPKNLRLMISRLGEVEKSKLLSKLESKFIDGTQEEKTMVLWSINFLEKEAVGMAHHIIRELSTSKSEFLVLRIEALGKIKSDDEAGIYKLSKLLKSKDTEVRVKKEVIKTLLRINSKKSIATIFSPTLKKEGYDLQTELINLLGERNLFSIEMVEYLQGASKAKTKE